MSRVSNGVLDRFRTWGYLQAQLDPLGFRTPRSDARLDISGDDAEMGRRCYCGSIGVEFMHIPDPGRVQWIEETIESDPPAPERLNILRSLVSAQVFEQVLQAKYPGMKRFSIEGVVSLIPLLEEILNEVAARGCTEVVVGMSHRGRLNVLTHIVNRPPEEILAEFEDVDPRSVLGGGDVKYHIGASGIFTARDGRKVQVRVVSGPSHLEAVDPVALGRVRAKQTRIGGGGTSAVLPILIHGDAAFAGQGIAAETLNLAGLEGFSVGGTVHIIANNLIGFTANPDQLYSSPFAADVAKRLPVPIFHVNGEDPEAVVRTGSIAASYRSEFSSDVVIDLIGYRRHGHSEIDDPTMTQPLLYERIRTHPVLWQLYSEDVGIDARQMVAEAHARYERAKVEAAAMKKTPRLSVLPSYWDGFVGGPYDTAFEVDTGVTSDVLMDLAARLAVVPEGFNVHPRVRRILERYAAFRTQGSLADFGTAEMLAYGTLLGEGIPVRLSGQDSRRGTFGHRHAVLVDTRTGKEYVPLATTDGPGFEVYNSMLSEAAVVGFEYGYSREYPDALVLWEAQFGDFANGAQIIIDQFIAAGEDKWGLLSGLVMLLPHGYEGQGPEHSSARLERFLQLAAEDNIQVCQPSTAAQYFHLLRRQALRRWRKPLIVLTPKSMLRSAAASSPIDEFTQPRFMTVLPDPAPGQAERVIVCTGKVGHELRAERKRRNNTATAIVFLEQLYPFPANDLAAELQRHAAARDVIWVQEEPANMGGLGFVLPRLQELAGGRPCRSIKRSASASPATGSVRAHELEQKALMSLAFAG